MVLCAIAGNFSSALQRINRRFKPASWPPRKDWFPVNESSLATAFIEAPDYRFRLRLRAYSDNNPYVGMTAGFCCFKTEGEKNLRCVLLEQPRKYQRR